MDTTTIDTLRDVLLARRDQILADLDQMEGEMRDLGIDQDAERGSLGNHLAEDGSNVMEQERLSAVSEDIRDVLQQINNALDRMNHGTYGICQRCGKPINPERLEAFPYVPYCIDCQSFLERERALRLGR
jgi:DnaK suppressor protein